MTEIPNFRIDRKQSPRRRITQLHRREFQTFALSWVSAPLGEFHASDRQLLEVIGRVRLPILIAVIYRELSRCLLLKAAERSFFGAGEGGRLIYLSSSGHRYSNDLED